MDYWQAGQAGGREFGERRSDSSYNLRVGLIGFGDQLHVECEREELMMSCGWLPEKKERRLEYDFVPIEFDTLTTHSCRNVIRRMDVCLEYKGEV